MMMWPVLERLRGESILNFLGNANRMVSFLPVRPKVAVNFNLFAGNQFDSITRSYYLGEAFQVSIPAQFKQLHRLRHRQPWHLPSCQYCL